MESRGVLVQVTITASWTNDYLHVIYGIGSFKPSLLSFVVFECVFRLRVVAAIIWILKLQI